MNNFNNIDFIINDIFLNINDFYKEETKGFQFGTGAGGSTNVGESALEPKGSTTIGLTNKSSEKEQETRATIGNGNIIVKDTINNQTIIVSEDGTTNQNDLLAGLNRDTSKSQEITKDMITGALDGSMTIDNRLLLGFINQNVYERDENGEVKKDADGKSIVMKQRDKDGNLMLDKNGNSINQTTNGYKSVASDVRNFIPNTGLAVVGAVDSTKFALDVASDVVGGIPGSPIWMSRQKDVPPHPFPSFGIGDEVMGRSSIERDENNIPIIRYDDNGKPYYQNTGEDKGFIKNLISGGDKNPLFRFLYIITLGGKSMTDNHDIESNRMVKEMRENGASEKEINKKLATTIPTSFGSTLYGIPGTLFDFKNYKENYNKIKNSYNNGLDNKIRIEPLNK